MATATSCAACVVSASFLSSKKLERTAANRQYHVPLRLRLESSGVLSARSIYQKPGARKYSSKLQMSSAVVEEPAGAPLKLEVEKFILYDVPVSNNGLNAGARVRFVIYGKGLEKEIEFQKPGALGGSKSEAFLKLNPQGLLPTLALPDGTGIFESEVISEYLLDKYSDVGPSYIPTTLEERTVCRLLKRVLDTYIAPVQSAMYREMDGSEREAKIGQISKQLDVLEGVILANPYAAGNQLSSADFALYPTFVFMTFILPRAFGWEDVFKGRPKLRSWWDAMNALPLTQRIQSEMDGALKSWDEGGRWQEQGITDQVKSGKYKLTY